MRQLCSFFLFIFLFLISPLRIHAKSDFASDMTVTYTYNPDGIPQITYDIALTNLTSQAYPTSYQLLLPDQDPQHLSGRDSKGPLKITSSKDSTSRSLLDISFNDHVAGLGKTLKFSLTYSGTPLQKQGSVWPIVLPKVAEPLNIRDFQLVLDIPNSFGHPAFLSPPPDTIHSTSTATSYTFSRAGVSSEGVTGMFGDFTIAGFQFTYSITNSQSAAQSFPLPLPADSGNQRIFFDSISPSPQNVTVDPEGNWWALYTLSPHQTQTITISGSAHLLNSTAAPTTKTSSADLAEYITPFSLSSSPSAALTFVSSTRSAGLPARLIYGYSITGPDFQHTPLFWAQSWNSQKEIWQDTFSTTTPPHTLALIHYKAADTATFYQPDSVKFFPQHYQDYPLVQPLITWQPHSQFLPLVTHASNLTLTNPSGFALYNLPVRLQVGHLSLESPDSHLIETLPPFAHSDLEIRLRPSLLPRFSPKHLSVSVSGSQYTYNISDSLFLLWYALIILIITTALIILAVFTAHTGRLPFQRRRR